jgi:hypothetical protein
LGEKKSIIKNIFMAKSQSPKNKSIKVEKPILNGVEKHIENVVESIESTENVEPMVEIESPKTNTKVVAVDYTKKSKYSETQLKKMSVVEYLNHPSLTKTSLGINPGDTAFVGQIAALDLEKRKIAKIISNRLETK